jgi:hypothetical protein
MKKKYFNNLITLILIVSFILIPYFGTVSKAKAQSMGISAYTSGLGSAIATLPLCKNVIDSGIKSLFNGIGSLFSSEESFGEDFSISVENPMSRTLNDSASIAGNQMTGVETSNPTLEKKTEEVLTGIEKIQADTGSLNENDTCLRSIGRLMIKMLLQKLTDSTVKWINSGFNGSPAFIQDPGKFFEDIARTEVLQFGAEIIGSGNPFGKDWIRNNARAFSNKFQDNAQYSLNELIQETNPEYSATTFQADFSMGGWNAWTAMTQVPANNPLGFQIMADNEIQQRLAGTSQSRAQNVRDALQEAGGFLGDERCVSALDGTINYSITRTQYDEYMEKNPPQKLCSSWEYVTPGKMVADAATNVIGYPNNAYLNVTDLNDAVAAILDALLNQFSSNLMEKGFANMGDRGANGALFYNSSGVTTGAFTTRVEKDFTPVHLSSSWLSANLDFNIRTDLTQALIDEQRTYSDKLKMQNKELNSTTDGESYKLSADRLSSNAYGLIPAIYQLDYCIPGPHPGWEEDAQRKLAIAINPIPSLTSQYFIDPNVTYNDVVEDIAQQVLRGFYSTQIGKLTGYWADIRKDDRSVNLSSKGAIVQVLNEILNRYIQIMDKIYFSNSEILPPVSKEATVNFNQLTGYYQMIKNNENKIASLKTTVGILGEIKDAVDDLNAKYKNSSGQFISLEAESAYENELKAQINAFGRLSSDMVNGDDIASIDNMYKQIIDRKNYIYNDLLKGPYGCEAFLQNPSNIVKFPSAEPGVSDKNWDWSRFDVNSVKRMTYPSSLPIIYDYNALARGADIPDPDPWKYCKPSNPRYPLCINKIPYANLIIDGSSDRGETALGPGFLSFVFFSSENSGGNGEDRRGSERLPIHDLITQDQNSASRNRNVGLRNNAPDSSGPFETTIGIY